MPEPKIKSIHSLSYLNANSYSTCPIQTYNTHKHK